MGQDSHDQIGNLPTTTPTSRTATTPLTPNLNSSQLSSPSSSPSSPPIPRKKVKDDDAPYIPPKQVSRATTSSRVTQSIGDGQTGIEGLMEIAHVDENQNGKGRVSSAVRGGKAGGGSKGRAPSSNAGGKKNSNQRTSSFSSSIGEGSPQPLSVSGTPVLSSSPSFASNSTSTSIPSRSAANEEDWFAKAQAMGLKLTREEFERSKAGLSAFLKAERAPSSLALGKRPSPSSASSTSAVTNGGAIAGTGQPQKKDLDFNPQPDRAAGKTEKMGRSSQAMDSAEASQSKNGTVRNSTSSTSIQDLSVASSASVSTPSSTPIVPSNGFVSFASSSTTPSSSSQEPVGPVLSFFTATVSKYGTGPEAKEENEVEVDIGAEKGKVGEEIEKSNGISKLDEAGVAEEKRRAQEKLRRKKVKEEAATSTSADASGMSPSNRDPNGNHSTSSITFTPSNSFNRHGSSSGSGFRFSSGSGSGSGMEWSASGSSGFTSGSRGRIEFGPILDANEIGQEDLADLPSNLFSQIANRYLNRALRSRNESAQSSENGESPNPNLTTQSRILTSFKIHGDESEEMDELSLRANVSENGVLTLSDPSTVPERAALAKALALESQESHLNDAVESLSLLDRVMETLTSPLRKKKESKVKELVDLDGDEDHQEQNSEGEIEADLGPSQMEVSKNETGTNPKSVRWAAEVPEEEGPTSKDESSQPPSDKAASSSLVASSRPSSTSSTSTSASTSVSTSARRHLTHARMSTRDHYDLVLHDISPSRGLLDQDPASQSSLSHLSRPSASPIWATSANVSGFRHRLGRGLVEAGMVDESASHHLSPLSARARRSSPSADQLSMEGVERAGAALRQISGAGEMDQPSSRTTFSPARGLLFSGASPSRSNGEADDEAEEETDAQKEGLTRNGPGPSLTRSPARRGFGPFDPSPIKLGRPLSFNSSPRSGLLNRMNSTGSLGIGLGLGRLRQDSRDSTMSDVNESPSQPLGHHGRMRSTSNDGRPLGNTQSKFPAPGWGKAASSELTADTISPAELFGYRNAVAEGSNPTSSGSDKQDGDGAAAAESRSGCRSRLKSKDSTSEQDAEGESDEEESQPPANSRSVKGRRSGARGQEASTSTAVEKRGTIPEVSETRGSKSKSKERKNPPGISHVTAEETVLPDGSRRVQLVSEELKTAIRNGKLDPPPPRYYTLPPHAGVSDSKPVDASYAAIIGAAIMSATDRVLSLAEIYSWITATYPFYKPGDTVWMNGVRYNLSSHNCFAKKNRDRFNPGKGGLWTIPAEHLQKFITGPYSGRGGNVASKSEAAEGAGESRRKRGKQSQAQEKVQAEAEAAQTLAQKSSVFNSGTFSRPRYQSPSTSTAPTPTSQRSVDEGALADISSTSMLPPNSQNSSASSSNRRRAHSTEVEESISQNNSPTNSRRKVAKRIKLVSRNNTAEPEEVQGSGGEEAKEGKSLRRPPLRSISKNRAAAMSGSDEEVELDDDAITPSRPGLKGYASSGHGSRGSRRVPMLTTAGSSPPSSPPDSMMPPPSGSLYSNSKGARNLTSGSSGGNASRKRQHGMDEDSNYTKQFNNPRNASSGWAASPYGSPLVNRRGASVKQNCLPAAVRSSSVSASPQRLGAGAGQISPFRIPNRSPISSVRGSTSTAMERGGSNGSKDSLSKFQPARLANAMGLNVSPLPASPGLRGSTLTSSIMSPVGSSGSRLQSAMSGHPPPQDTTPGRLAGSWSQHQISLGMGLDSTPGRIHWGMGIGAGGTPSPMRRFARSPMGGIGMGMGISGSLGGQFFEEYDTQGNLDYEMNFADMAGFNSIDASPSRAIYGNWNNGNGNGAS